MMERKEIYCRQQAFEQELATYTGADPLKLRYDFISWLDGNYGKENVMDILVPVLEDTLKCFWNVSQYQQDSRFIQLLITYISMQTNPIDIYKSVYDKGTGTESPIFYSSWANTYAERENFKKANEIFNLGLSKVKSKIELEKSYEQFLISLGKKFLQLIDSDDLQSIFPKYSNNSQKNQTNSANTSNIKDDIFEWALYPLKVGDVDNFKCPGVVHDPPDPNKIPMYPKNLVYGGDKEYSLEEIMARYYEEKLKQKEEARNLTKDITISKDELDKGEVKEDVAMKEHPILEVDNENEERVIEIPDQENADAHVAANIVQNHITPHKSSAPFPKPLLLHDSLTISHTSYTAHMKEAMNVVQEMWSSPTPAMSSTVNARSRTLYKNTAAEPPIDSQINNENGGVAQLPTRTNHFAIYTEEDNEVENCVPTPQGCAIRPVKPKAMTSVKKDSLQMRKLGGKSNVISERKPKGSVEIQDFEKRANTNKKQLPFSNASEDNRDMLATKLENISIANPASNIIKITNIKPLLPADPEDNISNETCNTEAFNFSLPTSTPIQNKIRGSSNRVSVESQGAVEDQALGKSKNLGELSMILEASKEKYSNSSSSNGCALRGQSTVPLQSVIEVCNPSKTWHSFLISNSIPRSSVSKQNSKLSPIKEIFYSINDTMKTNVLNNELNIVEKEEKNSASLELTLTGERNLSVDEDYTNVNNKETNDSELIKITEILNSLCKYVASEISRFSYGTLEDENPTISTKCTEQTVNTSISLINPKDQLFSVVNKQLVSNNKTGVQTRSSFRKNYHNSNQIHELEDPSLTEKRSIIEMKTEKNVKPKRRGRVEVQPLLSVQMNVVDTVSKRQSTCSDLQMDRKRSDRMKSGINIGIFERKTGDSNPLSSNTMSTKENAINNDNKKIIESKTIKANILKESNKTIASNHNKFHKSKTTVKNKKSSKKLQNKNASHNNCNITAEQTKKPKRFCKKKSNNENCDNNELANALEKLSINEIGTNKRYSEKLLSKTPALDLKVNRERRRSSRLLNQKNKDTASKGIVLDQDIDPFCPKLLERLLNNINFPQTHHAENYFVSNNSLPAITKTLQLGNEIYTIAGDIGKGAYARIVKATIKNRTCALKVEKPACKWEHYICREIQKRVAPSGKSCFMDIKNAYIFNGGSILETEWAQYGTLLNVSNQYKIATGKLLDNPIILHFAIELIDIIDYLHQCNIIHADIKPDNFVVRSLPNLKETRSCVQLIDFGRSIDMRLLPPGTQFTTVVKTEGFTCCEMKERKPWTYQTDLFGVLSTIHCLIIGEYMMVEKKDNEWKLYKPLPRTVRKVWDPIFTCLLNIESSEKIPSLVVVKAMLEEALSLKDKFLLAQNYRTLENIFKGK